MDIISPIMLPQIAHAYDSTSKLAESFFETESADSFLLFVFVYQSCAFANPVCLFQTRDWRQKRMSKLFKLI